MLKKSVFLSLLIAAASQVMALEQPVGRVILTVTGAISETNQQGAAVFDRKMLEDLGMKTLVTSTPWTEGVNTFKGPKLQSLLDAVGANGTTLTITALNDYAAEMPAADAAAHDVLMAMEMNGENMRVRDKGPIFMLYPFDNEPSLNNEVIHNRSVWQVKSIHVQ
ncbi:hypothetical protein FJM67_07755 [Maribrevibacterium harenarium]|uniref:Oxidoreductase molybdopterin-binding domain-containing protein n=1 Tax=Maribrevibacterium harenarium TaxID=2589817 RepID=A0A501WW23_9GAMM|nr:molybdopterin-dependent oxidoreductase [Maribrevibacterium harenarium]TPE52324.1 hypothetical protein FJM67_07755 [Maribrevibacterium harenarium]